MSDKQKWKPISTAPKDRKILICSTRTIAGHGTKIAVDFWRKKLNSFGHFNPKFYPAEYWMELPELPFPVTNQYGDIINDK